MKFTQIAADAFQKLQLNAGVLLTDFDPSTGNLDRTKIFGATTGGVAFTASGEYTDFGEDVDNVPNNTMELKVLSSVTATMSGTFLTVDDDTSRALMAAADVVSDGHIVPRADLLPSDFNDIWWVGDYSDVNTGSSAGFIAIRLINALSTGGFQIQSGKDAKGTFSFEFTGHYSLEDVSIVPYELYIQEGTSSTEDATLSALTIGSLTLTPTFSPSVFRYAATTAEESDTVTVTATSADASIIVTVNGNSIASGGTATWEEGANVVSVNVTNGGAKRTYVVNVTSA